MSTTETGALHKMATYMTLGKLEVELLSSPTAFDTRSAANYSEHALIGRKSGLQITGHSPDDIAVSLRLHSILGDPAARIQQLTDIKNATEVFALVMASGEYKGTFVLKTVDVTQTQTNGAGALISADVSCTLAEHIGDPAKPNPPGVSSASVKINTSSAPVLPVPIAPTSFFTSVQNAITIAGKVGEAASKVNDIVATAANGDVLAAVGVAGAYAPQLTEMAQQLPVESFADLSEIKNIGVDSGNVARNLVAARDSLNQGATLLQNASTLSGLSSAALPVQSALVAAQSAGPALARLDAYAQIGSRLSGVTP